LAEDLEEITTKVLTRTPTSSDLETRADLARLVSLAYTAGLKASPSLPGA